MFNTDGIEVKTEKKSMYQGAGVSERVTITEVVLNENATFNSKSITLNTINEHEQVGKSKRLSLSTEIREGKKTSGWVMTVKNLINFITSTTGMSTDEAKAVLNAGSAQELVTKLSTALVGKSARGVFGKREYAPGKFAIELYHMEPLGGTFLKYDPMDTYLNTHLNSTEAAPSEPKKKSDLPF